MSITGSEYGTGYQFGYDPEDAPVIEDFIPKEIAPIEPGGSAQSLLKAGDALTVDSKGNAKKAEPGDPVLEYALPEEAPKLKGKTLVDVFNNETPLKSFNESARKEYYKELPPSLTGYRPTCYLCGKRVDQFQYERFPQFRSVRFRAQCHGKMEAIEISDYALLDSKTTVFDIIEQRGFFRRDAEEEARRRDGYPPQYVRDKDGNITAVRYPDFANDEYDGPKFDTKAIRDIEEQMQLQAYREILKSTGLLVTPGSIGTPSSAMLTVTGASTLTIPPSDRTYTITTSSNSAAPPPRKPAKSELLAMLAEIEKTEAKPAMLELDQQRVIDL